MTQLIDTIEQLLHRLKQGDKRALAAIYSQLQQPLYGYVRRMGVSRQDADDILQTVFTRAWQYRSSYVAQEGEQSGQAWLFRIARNALNDYYRHAELTFSSDDEQDIVALSPGLDDQLHSEQMQTQLTAALQALPRQTREAIVLSRFSALSIRDIATLMNISENNVKVRIHRGLVNLREALNDTR